MFKNKCLLRKINLNNAYTLPSYIGSGVLGGGALRSKKSQDFKEKTRFFNKKQDFHVKKQHSFPMKTCENP
jgi:hypothetical protein